MSELQKYIPQRYKDIAGGAVGSLCIMFLGSCAQPTETVVPVVSKTSVSTYTPTPTVTLDYAQPTETLAPKLAQEDEQEDENDGLANISVGDVSEVWVAPTPLADPQAQPVLSHQIPMAPQTSQLQLDSDPTGYEASPKLGWGCLGAGVILGIIAIGKLLLFRRKNAYYDSIRIMPAAAAAQDELYEMVRIKRLDNFHDDLNQASLITLIGKFKGWVDVDTPFSKN
jgi:hypothetical protein